MCFGADRGTFGVVFLPCAAVFVGGTLAGFCAFLRIALDGGALARMPARFGVGTVLRVRQSSDALFAACLRLPCADGQGKVFYRCRRALFGMGIGIFRCRAVYGRLGILCRGGVSHSVRGGRPSRLRVSAFCKGDRPRSSVRVRVRLLFSLKAEQNPLGILLLRAAKDVV